MAQRIKLELVYIVRDGISVEEALDEIRADIMDGIKMDGIESVINEQNVTAVEKYK